MIVLNGVSGTFDSLYVQVTNFMATTSLLPWYVDWQESTGAYNRNYGTVIQACNATCSLVAPVQMIQQSGGGPTYEVFYISVFNIDPINPANVQIFFNNTGSSNNYILFQGILAPQSTLIYNSSGGWQISDMQGRTR